MEIITLNNLNYFNFVSGIRQIILKARSVPAKGRVSPLSISTASRSDASQCLPPNQNVPVRCSPRWCGSTLLQAFSQSASVVGWSWHPSFLTARQLPPKPSRNMSISKCLTRSKSGLSITPTSSSSSLAFWPSPLDSSCSGTLPTSFFSSRTLARTSRSSEITRNMSRKRWLLWLTAKLLQKTEKNINVWEPNSLCIMLHPSIYNFQCSISNLYSIDFCFVK